MTDDAAMISVRSVPFQGTRGFATLLVDQRREEIVLDVQISGGCMIILDEAAAAVLFALLGSWLAGIGTAEVVTIG